MKNLSDEEIRRYLAELDDNDDDFEDDESDATEEELKKRSENLSEFLSEAKQRKAYTKKDKALKIKNMYIANNRTFELYEEIDTTILTELIELRTQSLQNSIDNAKIALTKKVEAILMRQIPKALKLCFSKYNHTFIKHPGFMYKCSREYGFKTLWVEPNVPYFFEQFSEMSVIDKYAAFKKHILDKHVEVYHRYTQKLLRLEAKMATQLSGIKKIVHLLDFDVDYYLQYMDIVDKRLRDRQQIKLSEQEKRLRL